MLIVKCIYRLYVLKIKVKKKKIIKYATLIIFNIIAKSKIICCLTPANNLVVDALKKYEY